MESTVPKSIFRRPRRPHRQLDLLLLARPVPADTAPRWSGLPDQTRQALSGLLTRLLVAHADGARRPPQAVPEDDADER